MGDTRDMPLAFAHAPPRAPPASRMAFRARVAGTTLATPHNGAAIATMSSKKRGKTMNSEVIPGEREPVEKALLRFRRQCMDRNVVGELRRRKTFMNGQDVKKLKEQEVGKKRRAHQQLSRRYGSPFDTRPRRRFGGGK